MNYIKIASCALLIAAIGYFAMQSYKRSEIAKHIREKFGEEQEKPGDASAADRVESLVWLKDNLVPLANNITRPGTDVLKKKDINNGFVFSANHKIVLPNSDDDALTGKNVISDIASASRPESLMPDSANLYRAIAQKIDTFLNDIRLRLDSNPKYKNYFKSFSPSSSLTTDESAILDTLKGANEFYTNYLAQIDSAMKVGMIGSSNMIAVQIKNSIIDSKSRLREFAKNYFNTTLP